MASEAGGRDAPELSEDPELSEGSDDAVDEGIRPMVRWSGRWWRKVAANAVLSLAVLVSALGVSIVIACFINDRTIEEARGSTGAQVLDTSLTRTVIRFNTDQGRVHIPPGGVLYPSGLQRGQSVLIEYDKRNPDMARVAGRGAELSLLPVSSSLAVTWAVLFPTYWFLRRSAYR